MTAPRRERAPEAALESVDDGSVSGRTRFARPRALRNRSGQQYVAVTVLVVLGVVNAALLAAVVVRYRVDADVAAREAADYTPPAVTAPAVAAGGAIVIIGDLTVEEGAAGVAESERWPAILRRTLDARIERLPVEGGGYATDGTDGSTFGEQAARVPAGARAVVFFGGATDATVSPLSLARAATGAFATAKQRAADASLIVVGPVSRAPGTSVADDAELRDTLRVAARIAGARWLDPVAAGWTTGASSQTGPSRADERTIAEQLEPVLRTAISEP